MCFGAAGFGVSFAGGSLLPPLGAAAPGAFFASPPFFASGASPLAAALAARCFSCSSRRSASVSYTHLTLPTILLE